MAFFSKHSIKGESDETVLAMLCYIIEDAIHQADTLAASQKISFTDSNIRSLLIRLIHSEQKKAKSPRLESNSPKDQLLAELFDKLCIIRKTFCEEKDQSDGSIKKQPISSSQWIAALSSLKDSCARHSNGEPGSRYYLEFLPIFLKTAKQQ